MAMIKGLMDAFEELTFARGNNDGDAVDTLHHTASTIIFVGFAMVATLKQYVGEPIQCWVPAELKPFQEKYAESYCFINHMYKVPWDEAIPWEVEDRLARDISFYRWVPVIFLLMALLFKMPDVIWDQLKTNSGVNLVKMVNMAEETTAAADEDREKKIGNMGHFIDHWLRSYRVRRYNVFSRVRRRLASVVCFMMGKQTGTYLTGLYLLTKLFCCINVIGQFFLLSSFLQINFVTYGFQVLGHLNIHGEFQDLDTFPRVVFCDFEIRQLQNVQRFTVQCALSLNLFVEKMFAITWFWLAIMLVITVINFIKWIHFIVFRTSREAFISKYLHLLELKSGSEDEGLFKRFVNDYLRGDGVFLLRAICNNTNPILTLDLVGELWKRFKEHQHIVEDDREGKTMTY